MLYILGRDKMSKKTTDVTLRDILDHKVCDKKFRKGTFTILVQILCNALRAYDKSLKQPPRKLLSLTWGDMLEIIPNQERLRGHRRSGTVKVEAMVYLLARHGLEFPTSDENTALVE